MSDKVRLPKEVAEAIETLRSHDFKVTNHDILFIFAESHNNGYPALVKFSQSNFDTLIQALVNGYEVERTPEVIILEEYLSQLGNPDKWCVGFQEGIKFTLDVLDKKILGVNA